jgi:hypothetical protein
MDIRQDISQLNCLAIAISVPMNGTQIFLVDTVEA